MKTTEVISIDGKQAVALPDGFHFDDVTVSIRKDGEAVILEPVKGGAWPVGYFEEIAAFGGTDIEEPGEIEIPLDDISLDGDSNG